MGPALVIEVNVLLKSGVTATVSGLKVHKICIPFKQASSLYCFTISLLTLYCISENKLKFLKGLINVETLENIANNI